MFDVDASFCIELVKIIDFEYWLNAVSIVFNGAMFPCRVRVLTEYTNPDFP
jgi:hypothetical protein